MKNDIQELLREYLKWFEEDPDNTVINYQEWLELQVLVLRDRLKQAHKVIKEKQDSD